MATKKAARRSSAKKSSPKSSKATQSSQSKKTYATKSGKRSTTPPSKRWSAKVKTDSTKPAPGIFTKSAKAIAANLEKKSVSPKGPGQAMRMLSFYENRGGKNLSSERKHTLESAKKIIRKNELDEETKQKGKKSRGPSGAKSRKKSA